MPRVKPAPAPKLTPNSKIPHATATAQPIDWSWSLEGVEQRLPRPTTDTTTATFAPLCYERGYRYPLIVWLHGEGSNEHDLPEVMRHVSLRNYVAIAPRGAAGCDDGFTWDQSADGVALAEDVIAEAIETAADRFNLHEERVFIAGTGAGGTMALRLGLQRPEWFAGAATFDGPLPTGGRPLARVNEARRLPLMLASGRESHSYPEPRVCRDLSLLHSAGCRVAIRQYPGGGDLTTAMLADLDRWAMEIVCG